VHRIQNVLIWPDQDPKILDPQTLHLARCGLKSQSLKFFLKFFLAIQFSKNAKQLANYR